MDNTTFAFCTFNRVGNHGKPNHNSKYHHEHCKNFLQNLKTQEKLYRNRIQLSTFRDLF